MSEGAAMTDERPKRIQRKRTKGWKMPENTVYVGRPSVYGNPWLLSSVPTRANRTEIICYSPEEAVENYRKWMLANQAGLERYRVPISKLRGKNLACWCPLVDKHGNHVPCHADVLLEIANAE